MNCKEADFKQEFALEVNRCFLFMKWLYVFLSFFSNAKKEVRMYSVLQWRNEHLDIRRVSDFQLVHYTIIILRCAYYLFQLIVTKWKWLSIKNMFLRFLGNFPLLHIPIRVIDCWWNNERAFHFLVCLFDLGWESFLNKYSPL